MSRFAFPALQAYMTTTIKPILHFVHANSFPAGTYRIFFQQLSAHYDVRALDIHGHDPAYPVTDCWPNLVQELIDTLEARYQQPVILAGHSLGGMLAMMAADLRPDLARCVVLLDSPVVAGWRALLLGTAKKYRFGKQFSPARFSEKRRMQWQDADEAYQHFASKEMFAIWPPEVLRDYIQSGMVADSDGITLLFRREIESKIYLTLPHNIGSIARRGLRVPVGFIGGTESIECRQAGSAATKKLVGKNYRLIQGGHLIPMEVPVQTAAAVHEMISSFDLKD